jgi:hypothetical protein
MVMADDGTPASKRDLARVGGRLEIMHAELQAQIRDIPTEILRAFLPWQEPAA